MAFKNDNINGLHKACIDCANRLIKLCHLTSPQICHLREINSNFIVTLFQSISGFTVPDLLLSADNIAEVHNVQAVIDTLSLDLLGLSLSHIPGESIIAGDAVAILNLLEILEAVYLHLFSQSKQELSTGKVIFPKRRKYASSECSVDGKSEHNDPLPKNILKRKVYKKTLKKPHPSESSSDSSSLQEHNAASTMEKSISADHVAEKRKCSKNKAKIQDVEHLEYLNFEKKIRTLLLGSQSPRVRCQPVKEKYLKNLRSPLKRKTISTCAKSFLLPHNLRQRSNRQKASKLKKKESKSKTSVTQVVAAQDENMPPAAIQHFLKEFPGFHFPTSTQGLLTQDYHNHLLHMHGHLKEILLKKSKTMKQAERAQEKQFLLSNILATDLKQKRQLRSLKEQQAFENKIKYSLRDARLRSAKIRQYFDEYHNSMRRKLQQRNVTEELVIAQTFRKMLGSQKEEMRSLCRQVKEVDELDAQRHRQYLEALQNTYENQLSLLTEAITAEQNEESEKAKEDLRVTRKQRQNWRSDVQTDIRSLQKDVLDAMKGTHFRKLDAQNFLSQQ